jgi:hypothetical protein
MEAEEKQRQAEKQAGDKRKREEAQRRQQEEDARRQRKQDEENHAAQKREQEELRRAEQQQQHVEVGRSALWSPQVARRTDDVHGLGFGQVKTGSVMSREISLLTRAGSLEPEVDFTESPAPKRRTVRFAGLDSPSPTMTTGRRPKVETGGVAAEVQRWTQTTGWTGVAEQMNRDATGQSPMSRRAVSSSPHPQQTTTPQPY